jgi:hypothetical protein
MVAKAAAKDIPGTGLSRAVIQDHRSNSTVRADRGCGGMAASIFTCPITYQSVQHWLDDDENIVGNEYEWVVCEPVLGCI